MTEHGRRILADDQTDVPQGQALGAELVGEFDPVIAGLPADSRVSVIYRPDMRRRYTLFETAAGDVIAYPAASVQEIEDARRVIVPIAELDNGLPIYVSWTLPEPAAFAGFLDMCIEFLNDGETEELGG